jgi:alpha-L-fucosidase 2
VVDMKWQRGVVTELKILSRLGGNLRLRTYSPLPKAENFTVKNAHGENPNLFYTVPTIKKPIKHIQKALPQISLDKTFMVDVKTNPEQEYRWSTASK